jgi:hypothetical protein
MSQSRRDPIVRIARLVGDFGNPFYEEERQRDVWNEASAFGLQLTIWITLGASAFVIWRVGAPAAAYIKGALGLLGIVCLLTVAYAHRLGVRVTEPRRLLRLRLLPYAALVAILLAGLARTSNTSPGFLVGAAIGGLIALLALLWGGRAATADDTP